MDFVTGATGIVGRELVALLLDSGSQVKALRRESSEVKSVEKFITSRGVSLDNLSWVLGDTRDFDEIEEAMKGCSRVFHLAALVSPFPSEEILNEINVGGTRNVVNVMLESGVKDLYYISSVAALGLDFKKPVTEETHWEDGPLVNNYSRSKHHSELEVWRGSEEGLNVVILNPSVIIGEGDFSRSSGQFFPQIHSGLPVYPAGSNGFVSARDVASACVALSATMIKDQRFLLNSTNSSFKDLFASIARSINATPPTKPVKGWMINVAVAMFKLKQLFTGAKSPISKTSMSISQFVTEYDGSKIVRSLSKVGIKWDYEDLEDAIERTGKAYLSSLAASS
tara:strand:- start:50 stop:1066 length:1017 start_codon:yes stop_codon:yes gene_type:complete